MMYYIDGFLLTIQSYRFILARTSRSKLNLLGKSLDGPGQYLDSPGQYLDGPGQWSWSIWTGPAAIIMDQALSKYSIVCYNQT